MQIQKYANTKEIRNNNKSRLSTFPYELVTSSFTASNFPASNFPASDFPASKFPIDLLITLWSIIDYLVSNLDPAHIPSLQVTHSAST